MLRRWESPEAAGSKVPQKAVLAYTISSFYQWPRSKQGSIFIPSKRMGDSRLQKPWLWRSVEDPAWTTNLIWIFSSCQASAIFSCINRGVYKSCITFVAHTDALELLLGYFSSSCIWYSWQDVLKWRIVREEPRDDTQELMLALVTCLHVGNREPQLHFWP